MDIVNKINKIIIEKKGKWGDITHPGILEVPEDKNVMDLSVDYFVKLAEKKGRGEIVRALMNLYRWNKNDNPKLSKWAKKTQEAVTAHFEKEKD